ncbi:MAG: hypothetical protein JRF50_06095 [Deltaproteobacteria bacterium]|nr:hypothetical protein [Deltaproteobacteria bacterium]
MTRINYQCIADMVKEWSQTSVKGIVFEFYRPMKGEGNELWLNWAERDKVIDQLLALKETYRGFIHVSDRIYHLMRSDLAPKITQNGPFSKIGFSYDPMGKPKIPCQLGPNADCSRCGCILSFYSMLLTHRSLLIPEFAASAWRKLIDQYKIRVSAIHHLSQKITAH